MAFQPTLLLILRPVARRPWLGVVAAATLATTAAPLEAQYPLEPSPVLSLGRLSREVDLGGYLSVREVVRNDSSTFAINRARVTVQTAPLPYLALRLQGDLSAVGRTASDSSVPAFVLTDAYAQLVPPDADGALAELRPAIVLGQFKTPFSLEYLTSFSLLRTANRSLVVDRVSPRRDLGVLAQISPAPVLTVAGAVVNGSGPNVTRNPDGRQLVLGRLTLQPLPDLAVAGKVANESGDHRWGYDARWVVGRLILGGEWLRRTRDADAAGAGPVDVRGGYVLAAYGVRSWLQPVVKWERLTDQTVATRATWTTYGVNLLSPGESLRVQVNWIEKSERPVELDDDELIVQVIGIY